MSDLKWDKGHGPLQQDNHRGWVRNYVNRRWNIDKAGWFANLLEFGPIISEPDYEELIPRYSRMLHAKQCLYLIVKGEHDELAELRCD